MISSKNHNTLYKLFYIDSRGEKCYLQSHGLQWSGDWNTESQDVVLLRRWREAQRGVLLEIQGEIDLEREKFVNEWAEIHTRIDH